MTDSELVEAVAREALGLKVYGLLESGKLLCLIDGVARPFDPFHDANDLMMVLEKFDGYVILRDAESGKYSVFLYKNDETGIKGKAMCRKTLCDAILDAALAARRG